MYLSSEILLSSTANQLNAWLSVTDCLAKVESQRGGNLHSELCLAIK